MVIVLGGGPGTTIAGHSAAALEKPVVAIPSFGGAAKGVWETVQPYYHDCGVSDSKTAVLREAWDTSTAEIVVQVAEKLVRHNPFRTSLKPQIVMLGGGLVLLGLWFGCFFRTFSLPKELAVFLMLGLAAMLGTGLRVTLQRRGDNAERLSAAHVLTEATAGLLLAFGFALLYFVGGVLYTGKVEPLQFPEPADFPRVAFSITLLGLAAAFLLDTAAEKLRQRLEGILSSKESS